MSKEDCGSKCLVTQIPYVCMLQEWSQIMLPLVNTDLNFSLGKNLSIHAAYTQLNQDTISFMSVADLTVTGIREGTP